jgi:hypothetical protein
LNATHYKIYGPMGIKKWATESEWKGLFYSAQKCSRVLHIGEA